MAPGEAAAASDDDVRVRRMAEPDLPAVLELLQASLGWVPDAVFTSFFRWKHLENPSGPSPAWVASEDGEIIGLRTFLRWPLIVDGEPLQAVRAVDTATHPKAQGRGLFTRLTLGAIDALRAEGVEWIFNTPNDRSRPGYLKMGWSVLGRPPLVAAPRGLSSLPQLLRARVPAERWSEPCTAGEPAMAALADDRFVEQLLEPRSVQPGVSTRRSAEHLRWRYGFPALDYRALPLGPGGRSGLAVFRTRRRGPVLEAAVCEVLGPGADLPSALRAVARATSADVALGLGRSRLGTGALRLARLGPVMTARPVGERPVDPLDRWHVSLGDVELM